VTCPFFFSHKTNLLILIYLTFIFKCLSLYSLVDYSAHGGGNIQMMVAGMRKLIHTAQSPSEFNVEEQLLKSCVWDKWDELFKDILI